MSPELSILVAAADAAKQRLAIHTSANNTAAELADAAVARHKQCFDDVVKATDELAAARAAVDARLDEEYGLAPGGQPLRGSAAPRDSSSVEASANEAIQAASPAIDPLKPASQDVPGSLPGVGAGTNQLAAPDATLASPAALAADKPDSPPKDAKSPLGDGPADAGVDLASSPGGAA